MSKVAVNPALQPVLKKHVAAVHTSGELTLVERKVANVLLLNAYDNLVSADGKEPRHTIPVRYLGHMVGWDESKNMSKLKNALCSLQNTRVEFNLMKDGKEDWESMALLSYARVHDGICTYGYVTELARRLHDPDVFAIINIAAQKRFKGGYSLTLYENCVRYKNVRSTGWWELDKFRRLMGAEAPVYDDFKRLSAFVIKKAIQEINEISDIKLTVEYEREGRKVTSLRFSIEENPQQSLFGPNPLDDDELAIIRASETFKRLREHGIGERLAIAAMKQDPEQARRAIEVAEARDQQGGIKTTTGAYIRKLIEDKADLGPSEYEKRKIASHKVTKDQVTYDKLRAEFRIRSIKAAIDALSAEEIAALALRFFESLPADKQTKAGQFDARKCRFKHAMINAEFRPWLNQAVAPAFDPVAFDFFVREQGHNPADLHHAVVRENR